MEDERKPSTAVVLILLNINTLPGAIQCYPTNSTQKSQYRTALFNRNL
jgi:hypothetical protein